MSQIFAPIALKTPNQGNKPDHYAFIQEFAGLIKQFSQQNTTMTNYLVRWLNSLSIPNLTHIDLLNVQAELTKHYNFHAHPKELLLFEMMVTLYDHGNGLAETQFSHYAQQGRQRDIQFD